MLVRIPKGERASAADRAAWREALEGRPDLIRRLIDGEPALIVSGQGVLEGVYNPEIHVARGPLAYNPGQALILGHDAGLTPVTVIASGTGRSSRCSQRWPRCGAGRSSIAAIS